MNIDNLAKLLLYRSGSKQSRISTKHKHKDRTQRAVTVILCSTTRGWGEWTGIRGENGLEDDRYMTVYVAPKATSNAKEQGNEWRR